MDEKRRKEWSEALRAARMNTDRGGEEFERFAELASLGSGGGLDEARALMSTITDTPEDNGEGETILSILSGFLPEVRVRAMLDELPRLEDDGDTDWANSILDTLLLECAAELTDGLRASSPRVASIARHVLKRISTYAQEERSADVAAAFIDESERN